MENAHLCDRSKNISLTVQFIYSPKIYTFTYVLNTYVPKYQIKVKINAIIYFYYAILRPHVSLD